MARRRWTIVAWTIGIFLIVYAYAFIMATTSASEDSHECKSIVSTVTSKHSVPRSVSSPGSPAIFCDLGVHFPLLQSYDSVFIYGVIGQADQDAIIVDLRSFHRASHTRKMFVQFFDKENWKTWSDPSSGRSGGSRGPESPIRRMWIE